MFIALAALGTITCRNPADADGPVDRLDTKPFSLTVEIPPALIVNENALLAVSVRNIAGEVIAEPKGMLFFSSDSTIVAVSSEGVLKGLRRGRSTIRILIDGIEKSGEVAVTARVRVLPNAVPRWGGFLYASVGDSIQFQAILTDINGQRIDEPSNAVWSSSDSAAVSVGADGLAVAHGETRGTTITGSTSEGSATALMDVISSGQATATIRIAHASPDVGPVTFHSNKTSSLTVSFGNSVERRTSSGTLLSQLDALSPDGTVDNSELIRDGDYLTIFIVGRAGSVGTARAWSRAGSGVPPEGRFRLVHGGNPTSLLWMTPRGGEVAGLPELCYFDPGAVTDYYSRAGPLDFVLKMKGGGPESARLNYVPPPGRSVTLVITGYWGPDLRLLEFIDP